MKSFIALAFVSLLSLSAFAQTQTGDLTIPGEKWLAKYNGFVCAAFTPMVQAPTGFAKIKVNFEQMTTDSTLDNGLLKATFTERGKVCRYSAILLADNAASTIRLVESRAVGVARYTVCEEGKRVLDAALESNKYLYYGHPHNLAVMVPVEGANRICRGSDLMGINFVVAGRITRR